MSVFWKYFTLLSFKGSISYHLKSFIDLQVNYSLVINEAFNMVVNLKFIRTMILLILFSNISSFNFILKYKSENGL